MSDDREPLRPLSPSQRESLEEAVSRYQASATQEDADWLAIRGLNVETANRFRLGIVRDALPGHEKQVGKLAIPYLDRDSRALSIRFRCLVDHDHRANFHGKYASLTGEPTRMFNVRAIFEAGDEIHLCEGEIDAITLNMIGLPAVAIPGVEAWRNHHRRMLAGFSRIWIWGDPDEAGADFNRRIERAMARAKAVRGLDGDVNQTFINHGADALYDLIAEENFE